MKFDLVIQGPLNPTSLRNVNLISSQFENIIISYWSENDDSLLKQIVSKNVYFFHQPTPDLNNTVGVLKDSTFFYSIASTYLGLLQCKSPYVIKMRSDEIYENFDPLKNLFLMDDSKFVFGNIFAKYWSLYLYHIGDHLFACSRKNLTKTYEILHGLYTNEADINTNSWAIQGIRSGSRWVQTAESILAKGFLKSKNIPEITWDAPTTLTENFNLIDIECLGKYQATWRHGNEAYSSEKNRFEWHIKTMADILL